MIETVFADNVSYHIMVSSTAIVFKSSSSAIAGSSPTVWSTSYEPGRHEA